MIAEAALRSSCKKKQGVNLMKVYFVINERQYKSVVGVPPTQGFRPSVVVTDVPFKDEKSGNHWNGMLVFPVSDGAPVSIDLDNNQAEVHSFGGCDSDKILFDFIIKE